MSSPSQEDNAANGMASGAAAAFGMGRSGAALEEEAPSMRSVAIAPSAGPAGLRFPSVDDVGVKFGKTPSLGMARPTLKARSLSTGITVKKEWNEANWKVRELELVPLDFPLERTHREIHGADASEVAKRISNTLRLLSVEAEYDNDNAKAKCTTSDMVGFRIRLFAGGDDGLPVVVEVQRRSGSPISFMRVCRLILDGAEGLEVKAETAPARKRMPPFMKGPIGKMKCLQSAPKMKDPNTQVNDSLTRSMELLRSEQRDSNILGFENLCLLTDPLKTRPDVALKACKSIVSSKDCAEIREEIAVQLQKDAFLPEEFDEDATKSMFDKMHHLALVLVSNTLVLGSKDGCVAEAMESDKWFSDVLIPSLLDEVKSFEVSANNSYEAALGLTSLASCSDVSKRVMKNHSAEEDLRSAHEFGSVHHELLANEAERALIAMGASV